MELLGRCRTTKEFMHDFVDRNFAFLIDWRSAPGVQNARQLLSNLEWAHMYISLHKFEEVLACIQQSTTPQRHQIVVHFQNMINWYKKHTKQLALENLEDIDIDI